MSRLRTWRSRRTGQRGQSIVELAIVTPFLLLLLMGTVDVGRVIFSFIALEDAVQEGTVFRAHNPTAALAVVQARVTSSSNHPEVVNANVSMSACAASTVSVTATYPLQIITPIAAQILGGTVLLSRTFVGTNFEGKCTP